MRGASATLRRIAACGLARPNVTVTFHDTTTPHKRGGGHGGDAGTPQGVTLPTSIIRALLLGASLATLAGAARAQTATADSQATATRDTDRALGEIVVTATRREEVSRNVPVAVSSISGDTLSTLNSSGLDIRFLSSRVPSLQIESSFGRTFPRFYIRGLGNTDFDPNSAQPVSVVYDDVALESALLKSFPVFDLQSVQVLRGPQGTLFGRNTPAGVVKLDSVRPGETYSGYAQVEYGTYNTINAEAAIGGPIADGLSFRASGIAQTRDDWVTNTNPGGLSDRKLEGYQDLAGRFQLGYKSGDFNALVNVHGRSLEGTPRVFRAGIFQQGSNRFVPGFDKDKVGIDGITAQRLTQWGTNLHLDYHFEGIGTLYSITGYEHAFVRSVGDIDGGYIYGFPPTGLDVGLFPSNTGGITRPSEFSQEVRFASEDMSGLRLLGGVYYFRQKLRYREDNYTPTGVDNQDIFHRNRNENVGVFANAEYKATPDLTLRAGVRYSHDKKRDVVDGFSPNLFGYVLPVEARVSKGNVSWDASATYALSPTVNLYARAATGYLGPAIQDRVTFGSRQTVAKKQTTISGEGGIKGNTPDRRFGFALDGYWYRTKDLQLTAVGGAANSARLINADHAVGYGAELELNARPVPNLTLTASGSYNFTEIRDGSIGIAPCGSGQCTVTDPLNAAGLAIIDGNDLPQAPRYVANATLRYEVPLPNGDKVYFFTDWAYRSAINYFLYTAREFRGRALTEGGAKLGYQFHNGIEVAAFARNITNQIRSISAIDFNNLTGMINDPRIVGGEVRVSFK